MSHIPFPVGQSLQGVASVPSAVAGFSFSGKTRYPPVKANERHPMKLGVRASDARSDRIRSTP